MILANKIAHTLTHTPEIEHIWHIKIVIFEALGIQSYLINDEREKTTTTTSTRAKKTAINFRATICIVLYSYCMFTRFQTHNIIFELGFTEFCVIFLVVVVFVVASCVESCCHLLLFLIVFDCCCCCCNAQLLL